MLATLVGIALALGALRYIAGAAWILLDDSDEDFYSPHVLGLSTWVWRHIGIGLLLTVAASAAFLLPLLEPPPS